MIRKKIENTPAPKTRKSGWWTILQEIDGVVVLNIYNDRTLYARHCVNFEKNEYETYYPKRKSGKTGHWTREKVEAAYGETVYDWYYWYPESAKERINRSWRASPEDTARIQKLLASCLKRYYDNARDGIIIRLSNWERQASTQKRETAEERRVARVNEMMAKIPAIPEDIRAWIDERANGGRDYCMQDRGLKRWFCTACKLGYKRPAGKNGEVITCPACGKKITLLTRKQKVSIRAYFCVIQPVNDKEGVARHFMAEITCEPQPGKRIEIYENIRLLMHKNPGKRACNIYYSQDYYQNPIIEGYPNPGRFDYKSNPLQKHMSTGYLYDGGIAEAMQNTAYEPFVSLFVPMAKKGQMCNYNRLMCLQSDRDVAVFEMLVKNRFYRLVQELSDYISLWSGTLDTNALYMNGNTIEEVFAIRDRQKINRIRDRDGGVVALAWMREIEETGTKLSDQALAWYEQKDIMPLEAQELLNHMTPEQTANYLERQRRETYRGKSASAVVSQYVDYIRMCEKLHKDTNDAMIYRPKDLRRRHDEAAEEINRRKAEIIAEEYSAKFGEAEHVLAEIKDKYEWQDRDFMVIVPNRIADIVAEGNALHHCVGATERYFDRIKEHETYICFLRKVSAPEEPFYTIEAEPGGTIRQHRGLYDEEPEIEQVKPFLRRWQKEIRKRMSKEDHARAANSKLLREANIEELKEKNNTRVLQGLQEDFMEVV